MRGLCVSFTSSCFLFPIGVGAEKVWEMGGGGVKILGLGRDSGGGGGELLLRGGQYPITCHGIHWDQWHEMG